MMKMKSLLSGLLLGAFFMGAAFAQTGQLGSGQVWGNPGSGQGVAVPSNVSAILDRALGSTRGAILERGSTGWTIMGPSATAGLPWVSSGTGADPAYQLLNATGGGTNNAFFQVSGPAGSIKTYTFPNVSGTLGMLAQAQTWTGQQTFVAPIIGAASGTSLALGGATIGSNVLAVTGSSSLGVTTIGAGSAITSSGPGGALGSNAFNSTAYLPLAGGTMSGPIAMGGSNISGIGAATGASVTVTGALTSGTGSVSGSFVLVGPAGTATFTNSANGGNPTFQTPNSPGTLAVSALTPIVENGGTGQVSCPTCLVSGLGVDANVLNSKTANYTIATTDCGSTIQAGTGSTGLFTVTLPAVAGFAANCSVLLKNNDTGRGKILSGFPSDLNTILWPQQSVGVKIVNGAWASFYNPGRYSLTGNITVFVNPSTGSNSNDCLSSGNPCASLQGAQNLIAQNFDYNGQNVITIQGVNTTYTSGLAINQMAPGFWGTSGLILDLAGGTISVANNGVVLGGLQNGQGNWSGCAQLTLQNMTITTTAGAGLAVYGGCGQALINSTVTFGATSSHQIVVAHSGFIFSKGYTISGSAGAGASNHIFAYASGYYASENVGGGAPTITCTGSPAFGSFAGVAEKGTENFTSTLFSGCGSVTGLRYNASAGGSVLTGGGANFLPGNSAGLVTSGGTYDTPGTPTITSCGTSPGAANGWDISGNVSEGTSATGCTITFTTNNQPKSCAVSISNSTAAVGLAISLLNATTLTVTHPSASGGVLFWTCTPQNI